ncbi:Protein of unknown function [Gryllus bimaculatus]|nr:Protein of unknown function [Gryllus bimaculatus]
MCKGGWCAFTITTNQRALKTVSRVKVCSSPNTAGNASFKVSRNRLIKAPSALSVVWGAARSDGDKGPGNGAGEGGRGVGEAATGGVRRPAVEERCGLESRDSPMGAFSKEAVAGLCAIRVDVTLRFVPRILAARRVKWGGAARGRGSADRGRADLAAQCKASRRRTNASLNPRQLPLYIHFAAAARPRRRSPPQPPQPRGPAPPTHTGRAVAAAWAFAAEQRRDFHASIDLQPVLDSPYHTSAMLAAPTLTDSCSPKLLASAPSEHPGVQCVVGEEVQFGAQSIQRRKYLRKKRRRAGLLMDKLCSALAFFPSFSAGIMSASTSHRSGGGGGARMIRWGCSCGAKV